MWLINVLQCVYTGRSGVQRTGTYGTLLLVRDDVWESVDSERQGVVAKLTSCFLTFITGAVYT